MKKFITQKDYRKDKKKNITNSISYKKNDIKSKYFLETRSMQMEWD